MALESLMAAVCAGAVLAAGPQESPAPADAGDKVVATTLAVQTALQQGREQLLRGEYRAAVATLESQLAYINGNQVYLKALQDAYRGYVKELRLDKQEAEAQRYLRRLLILDKRAVVDLAPAGKSTGKAASLTSGKKEPTFRAKSAEDDRPDLIRSPDSP